MKMIVYNNKEVKIASLAKEHNIPYAVLWYRLKKGWDIEKALITPVSKPGKPGDKEYHIHYRKYLTYNGETLPKKVWAERLGISLQLLSTRLNKGWSLEKTLTTPNNRRGK